MNSKEWFLKCIKESYADFNGRARRSEYWYFVLWNAIIGFVLAFIFGLLKVPSLAYLYTLAVFVPSLAVGVRRLHDIGKSGWNLLLALIPLVGSIWLLILFCKDSQSGANQWGENPKGM